MQGLRFHALPDKVELNPLYVCVFKVNKVRERGKLDDDDLEPFQKEWMVEIVGYAKDDDLSAMAEELHKFANRLVP